ncbi:MAG: histidine kinase [Flavobacteriales bacterium]|nr:histidine kinase [Flavobacteriales bacterium]
MRYFQRTPIPFRIILAVALLLASLFLLQAYMHHYVYADLKDMGEFRWLREVPPPYLNFLFWALLTPLAYQVLQRWPFSTRPLWKVVLVHAGFGVLLGALHEVLTSAIYYTILWSQDDFDFTPEYISWAVNALPPAILSRFMEYWTLMVVLVAVDGAREMRERHTQLLKLKNELQVTQLNALKKQLQPHFLFNTLNTVSALMDEDINGARKVLSRLGGLLRVTLDTTQRDKVRLEREIDHVANYLGIESVRFRDRLQVSYDVPAELGTVLVPSMVLQPLVENAIKHGPDASFEPVHIRVQAEKRGELLKLMVSDNGKGCSDVLKAVTNGGIGLRNVRDRLQLLYGDHAHFDISSPQGRGFNVTLSFPLERDLT